MSTFFLKFKREKCKGCEVCVSVCPKKIIQIDEAAINGKGYHPACVTVMDDCVGCASCALMCPDGVISIYKNEEEGGAQNG